MGNRKEYHVIPDNDGWNVIKNNASRTSFHTNLKSDAITKGKQFSKNTGSELIVHGRNGKIQYSNSYGNDPYPNKDKK